MKIVTVIPLKKSAFKEELTYFTLKNIKNGDITANKEIMAMKEKIPAGSLAWGVFMLAPAKPADPAAELDQRP